eukprot:365313-Chlamydomonas_euryale.AAC.32
MACVWPPEYATWHSAEVPATWHDTLPLITRTLHSAALHRPGVDTLPVVAPVKWHSSTSAPCQNACFTTGCPSAAVEPWAASMQHNSVGLHGRQTGRCRGHVASQYHAGAAD